MEHIDGGFETECGLDLSTSGLESVPRSSVDESNHLDYCPICWNRHILTVLWDGFTHFAKVPTTATWCGKPEWVIPATALSGNPELIPVTCPDCRALAEIVDIPC